MAAKKGTIEKSLFNGHRRKLNIKGDAHVFLDPQGNKHTRLQASLPLLNESVLGMPEFFSATYTLMQKESSAETTSDFDRYMQGMSVAFFTGPTQKTKQLRLTGCELDKFVLKRTGQGESVKVDLHFQIDVIGNKELYDYMWDHHNAPVHVEFDYNQDELPLIPANPETKPVDDAAAVAQAKKNLTIM